ncbi:MAG: hypothetical protein WD278_21095 [Pirellulales bacterium]
MSVSRPPRRLFQFSLRGLLFALTAVGGWLGTHVNRVKNQREAVAELKKVNGLLAYEYQLGPANSPLFDDVYGGFGPGWSSMTQGPTEPFGPKALHRFLGEDFFNDVVNVALIGDTRDHHLPPLRKLARLEALQLAKHHPCGANNLTDRGLGQLCGMKALRILHIWKATRVTNSGLAELRRLTKLEELVIECPNLTDEGINRLSSLHNLRRLSIISDRVTDAGIRHLTTLGNLWELHLTSSRIEGTGLPHLERMKNLRALGIRAPITDAMLAHLHEQPNLQVIHVDSDDITDQGVVQLEAALPDCTIVFGWIRWHWNASLADVQTFASKTARRQKQQRALATATQL